MCYIAIYYLRVNRRSQFKILLSLVCIGHLLCKSNGLFINIVVSYIENVYLLKRDRSLNLKCANNCTLVKFLLLILNLGLLHFTINFLVTCP